MKRARSPSPPPSSTFQSSYHSDSKYGYSAGKPGPSSHLYAQHASSSDFSESSTSLPCWLAVKKKKKKGNGRLLFRTTCIHPLCFHCTHSFLLGGSSSVSVTDTWVSAKRCARKGLKKSKCQNEMCIFWKDIHDILSHLCVKEQDNNVSSFCAKVKKTCVTDIGYSNTNAPLT